jgi:hypothetical protein
MPAADEDAPRLFSLPNIREKPNICKEKVTAALDGGTISSASGGFLLSGAEFSTSRLRLLKVAMRPRETTGRIRLAFAANCPDAALFRHLIGSWFPRRTQPNLDGQGWLSRLLEVDSLAADTSDLLLVDHRPFVVLSDQIGRKLIFVERGVVPGHDSRQRPRQHLGYGFVYLPDLNQVSMKRAIAPFSASHFAGDQRCERFFVSGCATVTGIDLYFSRE